MLRNVRRNRVYRVQRLRSNRGMQMFRNRRMQMRLYGMRIFVRHLGTARRFYEGTLGLEAKWTHRQAVGYDLGAHLIVEESDGSEVDALPSNLVGRFTGCSIAVDDMEATYNRLAAKGVEFQGPP